MIDRRGKGLKGDESREAFFCVCKGIRKVDGEG